MVEDSATDEALQDKIDSAIWDAVGPLGAQGVEPRAIIERMLHIAVFLAWAHDIQDDIKPLMLELAETTQQDS
jgi:hypothetical protein